MTYVIEIDDIGSETCDNILPQIFSCFENNSPQNLYWSFLDFYGYGRIKNTDITVVELEDYAKQLKNGYVITWEELNSLVSQFEQIIDLMLVGAFKLSDIEHKGSDEMDYYTCYPIVISNLDGYYWAVSTIYKEIAYKVQKQFPHSRLLKEGDKLKGK